MALLIQAYNEQLWLLAKQSKKIMKIFPEWSNLLIMGDKSSIKFCIYFKCFPNSVLLSLQATACYAGHLWFPAEGFFLCVFLGKLLCLVVTLVTLQNQENPLSSKKKSKSFQKVKRNLEIPSRNIETTLKFFNKKSYIRATLGPLVCVWFRITNSIPWV